MNNVLKRQRLPKRVLVQSHFLLAMMLFLVFGTWGSSPAIGQDQAPTVLITGSSQGYGLAFVQDYIEKGWNIIATCRNPATANELQALAAEHSNVVIEELDVTDFEEIEALAEKYRNTPIDVLLNNAAINTFRARPLARFGSIDYDRFEEILKVNVIGPLKVSETFLDHVAASQQKKIVVMSATGASITSTRSTIAPNYRTSKTALNMIMHLLAMELTDRGVIVGIIAPGTIDREGYFDADPETLPENVRNSMDRGFLLPRETIGSIISVIDDLTLEDSGVFLDYSGEVLPW